jgi:zinc/manganese transport system permease protein
VSWGTVIKTGVLYSLVGLFHFIFRRKFLAISIGAHNGQAESIPNVKFWDFLFYTSFGFVVTSSVAIAGVLLVFSYLIVPSVAAMMFSQSIGKRLAIGWVTGAIVTAAGVLASFRLDLPTGATIVCTFGLVLILMAAAKPLIKGSR